MKKMKPLCVRSNQGRIDFNRCAQPQFANITNIGFGQDEMKIRFRRKIILCLPPYFSTRKISYALICQEIDMIEIVEPVLVDDTFRVLIQVMFHPREVFA